ncbi:MAG: hypothetical protein HY257_05605 [Chloroflexi bacterium]|nr:hypothetical protein [Chloroflexota bacterium]
MARWLKWQDYRAILRDQSRGMQLDLERAVLWPHSPLRAAIAAAVPWSEIGAQTFVLSAAAPARNRALGFAQARLRRGRPEADITFIAPALAADPDAVSIWYRLLAECAQALGEQGNLRLFAQLPSGDGVEQIFATCGFNTYTHEDIYRLNFWPVGLRKQNILRHQRLRDGWNLLRLYAQLTPRAVQLAEGMLSAEGQGGKIGDWWDQSRGVGYILEAEGELAGAVRVQRGAAAYWLRFWLHPQAQAYSETLLQGAFALLWAAPHKPIYCSVRDYESGLPASLAAYGFQHLHTRALLVKHLSARVKAPVFKLMPALEKRPEPAASVPHHAAQK